MNHLLKQNQRDWEDLASLDPFWSILIWKEKKHNNWSQKEFFETGKEEINELIEKTKKLKHPKNNSKALDFGYGVGRLSQALTEYFKQVTAIDISQAMIQKAKKLNKKQNVTFIRNLSSNIKIFSDNKFDLIYTNIVLQHIPKKQIIKTYIREFIRILKPQGLVVFQLPHKLNSKINLQLNYRLYHILSSLAIKKQFLYKKLNLFPIRMLAIPEDEIILLLKQQNAVILKIEKDTKAGPSAQSRTYYATK